MSLRPWIMACFAVSLDLSIYKKKLSIDPLHPASYYCLSLLNKGGAVLQ